MHMPLPQSGRGWRQGRGRFRCWKIRTPAAVLLMIALAGCLPGISAPAPTYTPDATLQAISPMLTGTAGAPTPTPTPRATRTRTPTSTVEVPLTGSEKRPASAGDWIDLGGLRLVSLPAERPETLAGKPPRAGMAFLDLEVLLENTSDTVQPYSAFSFRLLDSEDAAYQPRPAALGPNLLSGDLRPGERVRGHLAFEAPAEAEGFRLRYSALGAENGPSQVWIDLEELSTALLSTPRQKIAAEGEPGRRQEAAGLSLTIANVQLNERIERSRPAKGFVFLTVLAEIQNLSHSAVPHNPAYFKVQDEQGYEYRAVVLPSEALLPAGSLGEGERISGLVVFQIPADSGRLVLKFLPQTIKDTFAEMRVALNPHQSGKLQEDK